MIEKGGVRLEEPTKVFPRCLWSILKRPGPEAVKLELGYPCFWPGKTGFGSQGLALKVTKLGMGNTSVITKTVIVGHFVFKEFWWRRDLKKQTRELYSVYFRLDPRYFFLLRVGSLPSMLRLSHMPKQFRLLLLKLSMCLTSIYTIDCKQSNFRNARHRARCVAASREERGLE